MSQIKQLLILHSQGYSIKAIARTLGISKNAVKSYLSKMESGNLQSKALLSLEDPALDTKFHAGNPAYKDARYVHLKSKLDHFTSELKGVGVTKKLLWEDRAAGAVYPGLFRRLWIFPVLLSFTPAASCRQVNIGTHFSAW